MRTASKSANTIVNVNGFKLSGFNPAKMTLRYSGSKRPVMIHDFLSSMSKGEARKVRKSLRAAGLARMASAERRPVGLANPFPNQPQREKVSQVSFPLTIPSPVQPLYWTNPEPGIYLCRWFGIRRISGRFYLYQTDSWLPGDEGMPHYVAKGTLRYCQETAQQMIAERQSN